MKFYQYSFRLEKRHAIIFLGVYSKALAGEKIREGPSIDAEYEKPDKEEFYNKYGDKIIRKPKE